MRFLSISPLRLAVSLAILSLVSACSDGRPAQLSQVETTDVPVADVDPGSQANQNINNPTLVIPESFQVSDGDELTLVWSDEFDGPNLDPEVWFYATGDGTEKGLPGGWGNGELQYYLPDNAMIVNGALEITARREMVEGLDYTSARVNTEDRFAFKYGRIEASIKLPAGQGIWPAFWMLSQDSQYDCAGQPCKWAATGEIDIMEAVNLGATGGNEVYGTLHYGGEAPANTFTGDTFTPSVDVTESFHTYAVEWDEFEMRWYFDGQLFSMQNSWFSTAAPYPAPFDQPFHILLNVAVGGNFPGPPDGSTPFPVTMAVDWVRVYSGEESMGPPAAAGTIPDDVIYASDTNETVDLVFGVDYAEFSPFGSGSTFNNDVTTDADFSPAFGVTTGDGYGAQVGQFALVGFTSGFASGYATLDFKAKGLNEDVIRLKLVEAADSDYVDVTLTSSQFATALGNGWYQVSLPITSFGNAATADGLLFETGGTAPANAYTFLLTDFGFSGTASGGGGGGDTGGGGTVLTTFDEVTPPVVTDFGGAVSVIEAGPAGGDGNSLNIVRNGGDVFAGAWIAIPAIPSDAGTQTVSALVYSPTADVPMVAKAEFDDNQGTGDVQANETVVVGWQTLTWTFTNLDPAQVYNRFTLLPNLGTVDTATSYFFDNITLLEAAGGGDTGGGDNGGGDTGGGDTGGGDTVAGEIAANGGFESGDFSDWETFPGGGIQAIVTDNPSSGTYAINLNVPVRTQTDPAVDNLIKNSNLQAGNLTPGASVTVSFDMRGSLSGAGGVVFAELFSELSGGGTSKAEILSGGPLTPTTAWANYSYTTTLGPDVSGGVTLQLKASCGPVEGCGVDVFFDNISIVVAGGGDTGGGDTGGGEVAVNGGFESGDFSDWETSAGGGIQAVITDNPSSGTFAANLNVPVRTQTDPPVDNLIKNANLGAGNLTPGASVTVSFDMRGSLSGAGGVVFAELFSEGGSGSSKAEILSGGPLTPVTAWTNYSYTTTLGPDVSGGVTLQLKTSCGPVAGCGVDAFFDNVSIVTADGGDTGGGDTGGGDTGGGGTGSCGGAGELAINCDFETGDFSDWETSADGGIQAIVTDNPSSGTYAANLNVPVRTQTDPPVDNVIKNANLEAGNLTPGASITVSFDMRGSLSGAGGVVFAELFSELSGGGTSKAEILSGGPLTPVTAWTNYSYTTTLGSDVSGGVSLQLKTSCGPVEGCGVDAYFDNVSIVTAVTGGGDTGGGDTGGSGTVLATFDEVTALAVTTFGGAVSVIEAGPAGGDGNALNIVRNGGDDFAGAYVVVAPTPGDAGAQTLSALVYSPTANIPMVARLAVGDGSVGTGDVQANETVVVGWQTLTWTFTNLDTAQVYPRFAMVPNQGTIDTSTSYFFDNITLLDAAGGDTGGGNTGGGDAALATFDEITPLVVNDFGGAVSVIEVGPAGGDGNSLNIVRNGGDVFAGAWVAVPAIPSDAGTQTVSALVYSPTAGIPMVAKAEFGDNQGSGDVQANETVVVGWQTLTWTFTNLDTAEVYNRFVMLPNLGTVDTATSYFFDNITLLGTGGGG